jgi:hypothetical protein
VGRLSFGSLLPQYLGAVNMWELPLKGGITVLDHCNVDWGGRASSMNFCHSSLFGFRSRIYGGDCEVDGLNLLFPAEKTLKKCRFAARVYRRVFFFSKDS